jgi:hypothetical protein
MERQDALSINGAQAYLTFENIHLQNWTRYGLALVGTNSTTSCSFCTFRNITTDGPSTTSSSVSAFLDNYSRDTEILDCKFVGGGAVIRSQQMVRNNFRRCEIDGKNIAFTLLYPFNNNDADNRFENCFFHDCGPSGTGLQTNLSSHGNMFWHNTIIVSTSGTGVLLGSLTKWSRANSFRNNIVINTGTGTCMTYGVDSGAAFLGKLECNDLDYNVYYAPNGNAVAKEGGMGFGNGTLAAWQAYILANPGDIIAGGGTDYDTNSVEANPGLISATAPYDIHLGPGSICVDTGTSLYVAGPWISYSAASTVADDFEGNPRPAMGVDIGADEQTCLTARYWTNNPAATFNVDGVLGNSCSPAVTTKAQNTPTFATLLSSNIGFSFDLALVPAALVPLGGGGFTSLNGQIVNVNFLAPNLIFLNGGTLPSTTSPFPGNFSLNFNTPGVAVTIGGQMVIVDPAHADGFSLSQPCQLVVL